MHILHITLGFLPAESWGGPVKIVYQNSKELVRRGHHVTVYCTNLLDKTHTIQHGTFENQIEGIRVVYYKTWHIPWWPGTLGPVWLPELPRMISKEIGKFDIVHINGYRNPMLLPVVAGARKAGVPIITQPHGTMPVIVNSFRVKRIYDRLFGRTELEGIKFLIALQESERQQALAHGVPEERIVIIPNGIDIEHQKGIPVRGSFRSQVGLDLEKPVILFLGRINKKKGTDMLVKAFARISRKDAQLVIAGPDDGQLSEVKELISRYDISNRVWLPGLLTGNDVLSAFHDADLFVLPCRTDTFPTTIMESCLTSTPMVVTDCCEIADLVRNKVATITPFDPELFAIAMDELLSNQEKYEIYKGNCPSLIKDVFSLEAVVDQLEELYKRAVVSNN
jgi:glycosyltransferase involved in cell wall biosynthesis